MRIKYAIASLAVGGSLAASAFAGAEPASADPIMDLQLQMQVPPQSVQSQVRLQSQMQRATQSFAMLSNLMQTSQVTVTNVIGNMR